MPVDTVLDDIHLGIGKPFDFGLAIELYHFIPMLVPGKVFLCNLSPEFAGFSDGFV
jgi:hypothetical protein